MRDCVGVVVVLVLALALLALLAFLFLKETKREERERQHDQLNRRPQECKSSQHTFPFDMSCVLGIVMDRKCQKN
jgi:hypothetical protein